MTPSLEEAEELSDALAEVLTDPATLKFVLRHRATPCTIAAIRLFVSQVCQEWDFQQ